MTPEGLRAIAVRTDLLSASKRMHIERVVAAIRAGMPSFDARELGITEAEGDRETLIELLREIHRWTRTRIGCPCCEAEAGSSCEEGCPASLLEALR